MTDKAAGAARATVQPVYPEDWAVKLEADYDAYMEGLYEYVDADPYDEDHNEEGGIDASGIYFCGCSTCERRASWTWLMVKFVEGYRDGIITLEPIDGDA